MAALEGTAALIAQMDAQRQQWVELEPGKRVRFQRPLETEFYRFRLGVTVDHICEYVNGWEGYTEADLLGAAIGSSDDVEFDSALWARLARDRSEYIAPVARAIADAITAHLAAKDSAAKN